MRCVCVCCFGLKGGTEKISIYRVFLPNCRGQPKKMTLTQRKPIIAELKSLSAEGGQREGRAGGGSPSTIHIFGQDQGYF